MPSLAKRILEEYFPASGDQLVVGGRSVRELASKIGTPAYIYDAELLRSRLETVRTTLGPRVQVLFAMKANPNAAIAQLMTEGGAGLEVASAGEIAAAAFAGVTSVPMQFAGPGKDEEDFALARQHDVTLNVESKAEVDALSKSGGGRVAIRVNPPANKTKSRMRMSGGSAKFGVDVDDLAGLATHIDTLDNVELVGLHTYAGTQNFDAEGWLANAHFLLDTMKDLERHLGRTLRTLNFGGGFGEACFESDGRFDLDAAGEGLAELISKDGRDDREYFVELGRYLCAHAGIFLTEVRYVKESGGNEHAILDGGMHQHAAAAGLGTVIRRPFPMVKASSLKEEARDEKCFLGGPLCTPADAFPTPSLPPLKAGDLVAFLASGAYGLSFSNALFLSHPTPTEVLVDKGVVHIIRERPPVDAPLRDQRLPGRSG